MKNLIRLEELVVGWFKDRKIIPNGKAISQGTKTLEELREIYDAYILKDRALMLDAIGDVAVTVIGGIRLVKDSPIFNKDNVEWYEHRYLTEEAIGISTVSNRVQRLLDEYLFDTKNPTSLQASAEAVMRNLHVLASIYDSSLAECLSLAYDEIKDRKGEMNELGVFVKEADLQRVA